MQHDLADELVWIVVVSILATLGAVLGTLQGAYYALITGFDVPSAILGIYVLDCFTWLLLQFYLYHTFYHDSVYVHGVDRN